MAKRCLILGSANCLREDITNAMAIGEFDGVIACKGAGLEWQGELDAWVSLHPERLPADIRERALRGYRPAERTYAHKPMPGVSHSTPYKFEGQIKSGSSGLFACKVAIELGFDRLVLCGIPLEKQAGRIDGKSYWPGAQSFKQGFLEAIPALAGRARSMSGWTKHQLGYPTSSWLNHSSETSERDARKEQSNGYQGNR